MQARVNELEGELSVLRDRREREESTPRQSRNNVFQTDSPQLSKEKEREYLQAKEERDEAIRALEAANRNIEVISNFLQFLVPLKFYRAQYNEF